MHLTNTTGGLTFQNLALTTTSSAPAALDLNNVANIDVDGSGFAATITAAGGPAINATLVDAASSLVFDSVSSSGSATDGIRFDNSAGTFSAPAGSLTNATDQDVDLSGNNSADTIAFTYDGTITDDVGMLVNVSNQNGGLKDFNGAITDGNDGDGSGISLTSNTGATIRFDGGITLSTGGNAAFNATGGGTLAVTDANGAGTNPDNTIATSMGTPLNVQNTTIHADGLTFQQHRRQRRGQRHRAEQHRRAAGSRSPARARRRARAARSRTPEPRRELHQRQQHVAEEHELHQRRQRPTSTRPTAGFRPATTSPPTPRSTCKA